MSYSYQEGGFYSFQRPGMEVTPVMAETETGEEVLADFNVRGFQDIHEDEYNQYHWDPETDSYRAQYADYEEQVEEQTADDLTEEYATLVFNANPEISDAIEWAMDNLHPDLLALHNHRIDSGDYDEINAAVEELIQQYRDAPDYEEYDYSDEYEEYGEDDGYITYDLEELGIDDDTVVEVIQELQVADPGGEEFAAEHIEAAQQCAAIGNDCGRDMSTLAAQFHMGQIDAADAINWMTENYDDEEIIGNYLYLFAD